MRKYRFNRRNLRRLYLPRRPLHPQRLLRRRVPPNAHRGRRSEVARPLLQPPLQPSPLTTTLLLGSHLPRPLLARLRRHRDLHPHVHLVRGRREPPPHGILHRSGYTTAVAAAEVEVTTGRMIRRRRIRLAQAAGVDAGR